MSWQILESYIEPFELQGEQFEEKQLSTCQAKVIRYNNLLSCCHFEIHLCKVVAVVALQLLNSQTPLFVYWNQHTLKGLSAKEISEICSLASFKLHFFAAISSASMRSLSSCSFRFLSSSLVLCPLCDACSIFPFSVFFLWPRFKVGTQSTLCLSQLFAALPETKCRLHTRSFARIFQSH